MKSFMKKRNFFVIIIFLAVLCCTYHTYAETNDPISDAKNGIVEIFSGFSDRDGKFWRMKSGSGFLISNTEGKTYIVTNSRLIQNSNEEKTAYCKANEIEAEDFGMTDMIRIVIKGDVTVEASVLTQSSEMDLCILSAEDVMNEKISLKLGEYEQLTTGDTVYALGFPKQIEALEFQTKDVEIYQGNVQDKESNQSGTVYMQHSAAISEGNTGGPILDTEGYVVGINCNKYSKTSSERYFSLPINELTEVLDNFAIDYGSKKRDLLKEDLATLREECIQLEKSGRYKKASLTSLKAALAEAEKLDEIQNPTIEEMDPVYQHLIQAKDTLIPKMEKIQIVIYVLAVLIGILLICLAWILILNRKDRKKEYSTGNNQKDFKEALPKQSMQRNVAKISGEIETDNRNLAQMADNEEEKTIGLSSYKGNPSRLRGKNSGFLERAAELEITRKSNGQSVIVDKPEYLIGRNPNQVDLSIPDNNAVGRRHASISWEENSYFICDLGSANGTYIKDKKIPEGIPMKLSDGDTLTLADEEFCIKIQSRKQ